jgi:hypothetical protein
MGNATGKCKQKVLILRGFLACMPFVLKEEDLVEQKAKGAQLAHPVAGGQQPHESGVNTLPTER